MADVDDVNPDTHCTRHGKLLLPSDYVGVLSSGCDDCEPGDPDGDAFRGGEAGAFASEQQAAAQRLKL